MCDCNIEWTLAQVPGTKFSARKKKFLRRTWKDKGFNSTIVIETYHSQQMEGNMKLYEQSPPLQYSTVQYSTVQYSTLQYSTIQYSTVSTVQYSTV